MRMGIVPSTASQCLIRNLGIVVALATTLSISFGFAFVQYRHAVEQAGEIAHWNAAQAARLLAARHEAAPVDQRALLEALPAIGPRRSEAAIRLLDDRRNLVSEAGDANPRLAVTRAAPIIVAGRVVGSIVVTSDLGRLAPPIGFVSLMAAGLGLAVFSVVSVLPVKARDRALSVLKHRSMLLRRREEGLRQQNGRFGTALNNMSQGLGMFDGAERLVVSNESYASLYGLTPDRVKPGMSLQEIVALRTAHGVSPVETADQYLRDHHARMVQGEDSRIQELSDGRLIAISHRKMPGGGWLSIHDDVTEKLRTEMCIAHMAKHDALTDLPNRLCLREHLESRKASARRGHAFAVLYLDLDHFKRVNDTLGHPIGDALLKAAAVRLRGCVCETDMVARLGGDEFAIVQTVTEGHVEASTLASRIIEILEPPFVIDDLQISAAASIGIALAPMDGTDPDELIKKADLALYRAKSEGRGSGAFSSRRWMRARSSGAVWRSGCGKLSPGADRALLPAAPGCARLRLLFRGPGALAPSGAWADTAGRVHPRCRGNRPHHPARRMGPAAGLRQGGDLAGSRQDRRESVAGAVQGQQYQPVGCERAGIIRPARKTTRIGDHRVAADAGS